MVASIDQLPQSTPEAEASPNETLLAKIENDWRESHQVIESMRAAQGWPEQPVDIVEGGIQKRVSEARSIVERIENGGEDTEQATAELLETSEEPRAQRIAWAEGILKYNAESAGIDYFDQDFDTISKDPTHLQTKILAEQVARVIGAAPGSDEQKFALWNIDGFAQEGRVTEEQFAEAIQNLYPLLKTEKVADTSVHSLSSSGQIYGKETITFTPTKFGVYIQESYFEYTDGRKPQTHLFVVPMLETQQQAA